MRGYFRREPRSAGLRGEGAGAVPVRAPDPDPGCGTTCPRSCSPSSTASPRPPSPAFISTYTPLIAHALSDQVPVVEDLDPTAQLIIDGTLLQCWSWKDHPELYSGKHKTTGLNVQVACTLSGTLAWISDPQDGCTHDAQALHRSGLLDVPATDLPDGASPPRHIGDKGYIGLGMITPKRKPAKLPLHPDDKAYNRAVNQIRYKIERVIANIKTWRVLHTGYRRPPETFPETITAVLGLIFTYTL